MFTDLIKSQTAEAHRAMEQNPNARALLSEKATGLDYTNYLTRLYPFVLAFETNFYPRASRYFPDLDQRRKSHLIESDLKVMNICPSSLYCFPKHIIGTWFEDDNQIIGGLYVLEGSVLGARVIVKQLRQSLNPGPDTFSYFNAYGDNTGTFWRTFLQRLEELASPSRQQSIIKGAQRCFGLIDDCLNRHSDALYMDRPDVIPSV